MKRIAKFTTFAAAGLALSLVIGCSGNKSAENNNSTSSAQSQGNGLQPANMTTTMERGTANGMPTIVATRVVNAQVQVDAVDYDTRQVALSGPDGKQEVFTVDPAVKNFDQIHKGDRVNARFTGKVAVCVHKPGEAMDSSEMVQVMLPPLGEKPSIYATRSGQLVAKVTDIDHSSRVVSVVGPGGNTLIFQVAPQAKGLENVQVGDQVVVEYTESAEITVTGSGSGGGA